MKLNPMLCERQSGVKQKREKGERRDKVDTNRETMGDGVGGIMSYLS